MAEADSQLEVGPIALDVAGHAATKNGQRLNLTVTEFRLLHYLMTNAGSVVPTHAILRHVWKTQAFVERHVWAMA